MRKKDIFSNPITKIKEKQILPGSMHELGKWEIDTRET